VNIQEIIDQLTGIAQQYNQLIFVVGPNNSGKSRILHEISAAIKCPLINLNLELARLLIELIPLQRSRQLRVILDDLLTSYSSQVICLDNTEMIFSRDFAQDPVVLLQVLSRDRTLIVAWNGTLEGNHLVYAEATHPEYRKYAKQGIQFVSAAEIQAN
jgi:predicted ATP-binding protein involved in virulence